MIRSVKDSDAEVISRIYNHYILETIITFEEAVVTAGDISERIKEVCEVFSLPWLVLEENNQVVGYAYATKWKGRCAYRHSVETTVYLDPAAKSKGYGSQLYAALIAKLRERSIHAAIGGIALPNEQSVGLHEKFGFEKVAHFKEVGWKFKTWIDVGYWELIL